MHSIRITISVAAMSIAIASAALPWIGYAAGLANVRGRPEPPAPAEVKGYRASSKAPAAVGVPTLSPYDYVVALLRGPWRESSSGALAAWVVARNYNASHLVDRRMLLWHASGAALTVWLTRNWTSDQILAAAARVEQAASNKPLQPTRAAQPFGKQEAQRFGPRG